MKIFAIAAVVLGLSVAASASASASDLYLPEQPMTPVYDDGAFPWEGLYFGVTKGGWISATGSSEWYIEVTKVAGFNILLGDNFVLGAEATVSALVAPAFYLDATITGHAGILIDDSVLIYKLGGVGFVDGDTYGILGAGVEVAIGDSLALRGEVRAVFWDPGVDWFRPSVGLIWHLN